MAIALHLSKSIPKLAQKMTQGQNLKWDFGQSYKSCSRFLSTSPFGGMPQAQDDDSSPSLKRGTVWEDGLLRFKLLILIQHSPILMQ